MHVYRQRSKRAIKDSRAVQITQQRTVGIKYQTRQKARKFFSMTSIKANGLASGEATLLFLSMNIYSRQSLWPRFEEYFMKKISVISGTFPFDAEREYGIVVEREGDEVRDAVKRLRDYLYFAAQPPATSH